MNGVHDMGGMHGFGAVEPEANEPVFHAPWEGRVLAMNRAMGSLGLWNIDIGRFSRETLPPDVYLGSSYYRKWTLGLEDLALNDGHFRHGLKKPFRAWIVVMNAFAHSRILNHPRSVVDHLTYVRSALKEYRSRASESR